MAYLCGFTRFCFSMRISPFAAGLVLLMATSCSKEGASKPENQLMANDFESMAGWVPESPSLTHDKAHSGQYSIKTDNAIEYSMAYKNLLGTISPTKLTKLRLTGYVYVTKPNSPAMLTVQLVRSLQDEANVFNQAIDLGKEVKKAGEWTKVSQVFTLPAEVAPTNHLRVYLWRAGSADPVYVDDLELTREP